MSLNHGRDHVAIPGPSVIPERVLRAMHRPAPNIYAGEMVDLVNGLFADLNAVARCDGDAAIFIGNGHAAWEASLTNTLSRGDKILAVHTGRFVRGWSDMASFIGVDVQHIEVEAATALDTDSLQSVLRADAAADIKAVLITHTDTASTVRNDIAAVRGCIDAVDHPALLMVDCIASLGCEPYHMSEWGVDVTVAACQKGLMTPPGLAFNFIGKKAWQAYQRADLKTAYWDWDRRVNGAVFHQKFCGTPATHHVYGLREALDMIAEEGLENIWSRHAQLVNAVWAAVDAWSTHGGIKLLVDDKACRSIAVTAIETAEGDATAIRQWAENEAGVVLGVGLELESVMGGQSNQLFRIGHMGHLNPPMLLGTLATVDTALKALNIDHGSGALEAASAALAQGS